MKRYGSGTSAFASVCLLALAVPASAQTELRMLCIEDGVTCAMWQTAVDDFQAENLDIQIALEQVPYTTILEGLPVQLAAGDGPDLATVTDLGGLSRYYLDMREYVDAERMEADYGPTLDWLRADKTSDAIYGFQNALTLNGAYVNKTLFEQAGVELPGEDATWEDWAAATKEVADATGTEFAMEMDRSGHRFASLAVSYGARLVNEDGMPVIDEGYRKAAELLIQWHRDGLMPLDLWGATGGTTHRELIADFTNANTVLYFSGSWTLGIMDRDIGDLFDWAVVPTPCGTSSCTAQVGGTALAAFAVTDEPEAVAKFVDFVSRPKNNGALLAQARELPANATLVEEGIDYEGASEATRAALAIYTAQIPKVDQAAYTYQGWRFQRAMMNATVQRLGQAINNELTLDEALERIKTDTELAIQAAQ